MSPAAYPCGGTVSDQRGERAKVNRDGTRSSSVPQSAPQAVGFHHRLAREVAGDPDTAGPGSPIAKDVPVLRVNHVTPQAILPGMR
jgi:hypothetical protein